MTLLWVLVDSSTLEFHVHITRGDWTKWARGPITSSCVVEAISWDTLPTRERLGWVYFCSSFLYALLYGIWYEVMIFIEYVWLQVHVRGWGNFCSLNLILLLFFYYFSIKFKVSKALVVSITHVFVIHKMWELRSNSILYHVLYLNKIKTNNHEGFHLC